MTRKDLNRELAKLRKDIRRQARDVNVDPKQLIWGEWVIRYSRSSLIGYPTLRINAWIPEEADFEAVTAL